MLSDLVVGSIFIFALWADFANRHLLLEEESGEKRSQDHELCSCDGISFSDNIRTDDGKESTG